MDRKKKKGKKVTLIWVIIILIIIFLITFAYYNQGTADIIKFDYNVGDNIGINADSDKLHFGTGLPGSYLERILFMESEYRSIVTIKSSREEVYPSEAEFVIDKEESKKIKLIASIPPDAEKGIYKGKVTIYQRRLKEDDKQQ